ncbi:hypothetical protein NA57DRAFT_67185 [Rhizodiscina lignyota]|uniref:Aromatic amino acid beta-eliminating lyase/threonine aldolase domain-containing protein n=1 Tax=Rhizodiscina lignyota TaxID=1504668 RepID=A0A9P4M6L4_9PEZI|nr:hypothetical protein NA57DRAFT_67185 [Rhizodiscina lignyota]
MSTKNGTVATDGSAPPKPNNWASPGPAAFDFRSDTITTPTASMLAAISACTLLDDVFVEDPTTNDLESFIASLTGFPAALLVLSGTMGNQVALRSHLAGPPHSILCDHRAHILKHEAGGCASLSQAMVMGVTPKNGVYLTLEDVQENADLDDNVHHCPTKVISLENTLGGAIMPLEECRKISEWARERGIIMHLDGARLWEAVAADAGTLKEYCALFDSVSLCFSKGLGAPIGSIIVGCKDFIKRCRWIRKSIGGGLRMVGVISSAARVSVEETFLSGKLKQSHANARRIEVMWKGLGGKVDLPVETNMVWLNLKAAGISADEFIKLAQTEGLRTMGGRLVVHYQICEEAIQRLESLAKRILKGGEKRVANGDVEIPPKKLKIHDER